MNFILRNIQSFKEAKYEFPDTGLVQIIGDNSNGKSILNKALSAIVSLKITSQEERDALINDNEEAGTIIIEYKGRGLIVHLSRERNKCYMILVRSQGDKITRTFREGGLDMLLYEFGFRVYNKNSLCLQLYDTFGIMPFVNTTTSTNYEIIDSVTSDTIAQQFLTNFREVTHKTAKDLLKQYDSKLEGVKRVKNSLMVYDYLSYEELNKRLTKLYRILKYLEPIELPIILIPPVITLIAIEPPVLHKMLFLQPIPIMPIIINVSEYLSQLDKILEGYCPTCGKKIGTIK